MKNTPDHEMEKRTSFKMKHGHVTMFGDKPPSPELMETLEKMAEVALAEKSMKTPEETLDGLTEPRGMYLRETVISAMTEHGYELLTDEITFLEGLKIWLPTHKITDVENRIKQLKS